ncbi:MAG TPA: hypothetical protein VH436_00920 [Vicinamibacterales bacterium]
MRGLAALGTCGLGFASQVPALAALAQVPALAALAQVRGARCARPQRSLR